ncbi:uncharacterized protein LOC126836076 isoform X2 [Adelges cooleyi]|uniref:uncharacterized protein LOC126836076 isoform X2 n=1 Tax=Adelges cooleyi TaxID=133065 RepID=UPI00217F614B|nr:uncharacterized protein LOC126836076 isoform X2 [Adelges cooleyi]
MKLFWFLVSCVIVDVSTDELLREYKKSVSITTNLIYDVSRMNIIRNHVTRNGLEYVIEKIVENSSFTLEMMNNMFAVPDFHYLRDWNICKDIQEALRRQMTIHLSFRYDEVPDPNFEAYTLVELAAQRRSITLEPLKRLWNRAIGWTCRFIALFMSTKYPQFFTQDVVESGTLCTISSRWLGSTRYRKFEGRWWRVLGNDVDTCVELVPEPV